MQRLPSAWIKVLALSLIVFWLHLSFDHAYRPGDNQANQYSGGQIGHLVAEADTAAATRGMEIFTAVLAVSTIGLWWSTHNSVRLTERALTELEQPVIVPEVRTNGLKIEDTARLSFTFGILTFVFANYGRTPAFLIELADEIYVPTERGKLPTPMSPADGKGQQMPWGIVSAPDKGSRVFDRNILGLTLGDSTTADGLQAMLAGQEKAHELGVFWHGYVRYKDIFGRTYCRGFCFLYHHFWDHWAPAGGDAFNYIKLEAQEP